MVVQTDRPKVYLKLLYIFLHSLSRKIYYLKKHWSDNCHEWNCKRIVPCLKTISQNLLQKEAQSLSLSINFAIEARRRFFPNLQLAVNCGLSMGSKIHGWPQARTSSSSSMVLGLDSEERAIVAPGTDALILWSKLSSLPATILGWC